MDTRQLKHRLMEQYRVVKTIESDTTAHKTIDLIQKEHSNSTEQPSYPKRFFMKREKKCMKPLAEVIGLELLRYLIPHQPKASLLIDNKPDEVSDYQKLYIISREIDGFEQFYKFELSDLIDDICDGTYNGLGEEIVATLFVGDDDFHRGNVGVDSENRVVRIDGGFFFDSDKKLTKADIDALPLLDKTYPKNWLGIAAWDEDEKSSSISDENIQIYKKMAHQPDFRREVNRMLLRILVQPSSLLTKLVSAYEPDTDLHNRICHYLNRKQNELMRAALGNEEFSQYLFSQESLNDLGEYFYSAVNFKTIGKQPLLQGEDIDKIAHCHCALLKEVSKHMQQKNSSYIEILYQYVCGGINTDFIDSWRESMKAELVKLINERNIQTMQIDSSNDEGSVASRTRSRTIAP